jgi:hypothetical protein
LNLGFSAVQRKYETHDRKKPVFVETLERYSGAGVPVFPEKTGDGN